MKKLILIAILVVVIFLAGCIAQEKKPTARVIGLASNCGQVRDNTTLKSDIFVNNSSYGVGKWPHACIYIVNSSLTFDCNGHTIDGNNFKISGILVASKTRDITIKNCKIKNFGIVGLRLVGTPDVKIEGNEITYNGYGGISVGHAGARGLVITNNRVCNNGHSSEVGGIGPDIYCCCGETPKGINNIADRNRCYGLIDIKKCS